jgi:hypothetical protein
MRILIACEESQVVCKAFREKGHEAFSCDVQECSGGHPEWHIQDDVLKHLNDGWDLMIAHPPCTFLCRNRAKKNKEEEKLDEIQSGYEFFKKLQEAPIQKICIENPVPSRMSPLYQTYNQIIQPYQFGHDFSKKTCLWLKNLPLLKETKRVKLTYITTQNGHRYTAGWYKCPRNSKARSKTFSGIAKAMAEQWDK